MTLICCLAIICLKMSLFELFLLLDPRCHLWLGNESIQLFTNLKGFCENHRKDKPSSPSVSTANLEWHLSFFGIEGSLSLSSEGERL